MRSSIIKQTPNQHQSQQTQTLSKSKQVTINNIQSIKSMNINSQTFENNKSQKNTKIQNIPQNHQTLIAHKYDPFNKNHYKHLEIEKKEIEKQLKTELDPEKLQVMNSEKISKEIEKNIEKKKKEEELEKIRKQEEEEKAKKKKSAKEKAAQQELEKEEQEKREKEYKRLQELDQMAKKKQELLSQEKQNQNQNIQFKTFGKNIDPQEKQQFEQFLQQKKQEKSIVVRGEQYLKPQVFESIFSKADVIGNLSYVGDEDKKQIGPSYDQNGEIIPSSILGRPEWFQNQEKRMNGQVVTQDLYSTNNSKKRQRPLSSCPMYSPKSISMNLNVSKQKMQNSKQSNDSAINKKIIPLKKGRFMMNMDLIEQKQMQKKLQSGNLINIKNEGTNSNNIEIPQVPSKNLLISQNNNNNYNNNNLQRPYTSQPSSSKPRMNSIQFDKRVVIQDIEEQYANGQIDDEEYEQFMYTIQEEEVAGNIRLVQERLKNNKKEYQKYNKGIKSYLSKGDVLYLTKEERALKKFEQEQLRMKKFIQKTSKMLQRDEEDSVYIQSNNFRSKLETNLALDVIQPDIIRIGEARYWQHKLRDFRTEDQKYDIYNKDAVQLEVIRRPKSSLLKSKAEGVPPFTTFTSGKIFQEKLNQGIDKLAKISHLDDREMDLLEIKGENKFKIEKNCLLKGSNNEYMNNLVSVNELGENESIVQDQVMTIENNQNVNTKKSQLKKQKSHEEDLMFHSSHERQYFKQQQLLSKVHNTKDQMKQNSQKNNNNNEKQQIQQLQQNLGGSQVSFVGVDDNKNNLDTKKLNRYQQFDLENRKMLEQQQRELEQQYASKKKTVYKIKKKIQDDNEGIHGEDVIYSNWVKEEIRGTGGAAIKKFQLKV